MPVPLATIKRDRDPYGECDADVEKSLLLTEEECNDIERRAKEGGEMGWPVLEAVPLSLWLERLGYE